MAREWRNKWRVEGGGKGRPGVSITNSPVTLKWRPRGLRKCEADRTGFQRWIATTILGKYLPDYMESYYRRLTFIFTEVLILIYLLTAIGLTPGRSSTVHIYSQTIHRTTQLKSLVRRLSGIRTQSSQTKINDELTAAKLSPI